MERKKASDFPQELLDVFDKYVHGEISRREFLDHAQKYAVGGLTGRGDLGSIAPELCFRAASAEGRQPIEDRVRHRAIASGQRKH